MKALLFDHIQYRTKNELAYTALREAIVSGKLPPGTRIVIKEIADELGTSEIPVREAIRLLEAERLVEAPPHLGPRVAKISIDELADILPVRATLEAYATKLAALRQDPELATGLSEILTDMHLAVKKTDTVAYGKLNHGFHMSVYESCGNEYLRDLIVTLWENTERARSVFTVMPELLPRSIREHEQIKAFLEDGRCEEIQGLVYEHKISAFQVFLSKLEAEDQGGG
ncbi:MAG TPA: GntR family transcriptional regulator [Firmicutes bacterium]|nr:GntR family transcriptional regulator [Bacillota bacterium]